MILHPLADGLVAISQSAHAFLAFQLGDHWGNRNTPRPTPRPEVLAAVLLHDAGWDGTEEPPRLAPNGLPVAFDTLPDDEREPVWEAAVTRAALRGRFVAYLVSHHVTTLAVRFSHLPHREFLAREEARRARLCAELRGDTRYAAALRGRADECNRAIVRLADEIAVHLSRGAQGTIEIQSVPQDDGNASLTLTEVGPYTYRVRPWPFVGRRLDLHAEGRRLAATRFADEDALCKAWSHAGIVRLRWSLLSTGTPQR
jgi:hypothetical protein